MSSWPIIGHGDIFLERGIGETIGIHATLGINRSCDGGRLVQIGKIHTVGIGNDGHAGELGVVRRRLRGLHFGRSAPKRAFGSTASGDGLLVDSQGLVGKGIGSRSRLSCALLAGRSGSRGRGVRRRRAVIGGIVGGVGYKRHEGCGAARRGGVRARDGACGSGNVIAIVRTGLSTVGELVDCNLVDIARTCGIAADRESSSSMLSIIDHASASSMALTARAMVGTPSSAWRR